MDTTTPSAVLNTEKKYNILLLTNRDSDNVGDQVIEACDISLIRAIMKNLNISKSNYKINSRAASFISQKYLATKDPKLLEPAINSIKKADAIVFGGAPLFNYQYQTFYERTAVTLELANKYHKPVLFSAIGIEGYDEDNEKCQRLKKTLNFDIVKQITTRDDFDLLQKYKVNPQLSLDKVSDPAVFSNRVFESYQTPSKEKTCKKIGLFILRANGFIDNKVDFSREDSAKLWLNLTKELDAKGYDYELITSGHFGDEAFLDYLIRHCNVAGNKCVFNMNTPEQLIRRISSYDAVISCRLHPSIISFSLGVPSLGIVWNTKVRGFYNSIGYSNRIIETDNINAADIVARLEQAISEGVTKDEKYLTSVYNSLFYGIKQILFNEGTDIAPYTYSELMQKIPIYGGTSEKALDEKLQRKFRRAYKTYNERFDKNIQLKEENDKLKNDIRNLCRMKKLAKAILLFLSICVLIAICLLIGSYIINILK